MLDAPAGYLHDDPTLPPSPVSVAALDQLHQSVLWSDEDVEALQQAAEILVPQTEQILDVWYGFVGSNPHLVATFGGSDGAPSGDYLAAVRERFGRWIQDLCTRPHDRDWLAYQEEIALRHHPAKKNTTDGIDSTSSHVPLGHLIALAVPITVTIRDFLRVDGVNEAQVDAMYHAWFKAVVLSVALWARPYSADLW